MAEEERDPLAERLRDYLARFETYPRPTPPTRHAWHRHLMSAAIALGVATTIVAAVAWGRVTNSSGRPNGGQLGASASALNATMGLPGGDVPWAPLPPSERAIPGLTQSPSPAPAVPPGTPDCRAAQLDSAHFGATPFAGHSAELVFLRNTGASACRLEGFADVTVLDTSGAVLASAAGASDRGTAFNDAPSVPVLMQPGTPTLQMQGRSADAVQGQAFMNVEWYDCRQRQASRLAVDLPDGGGRVIVPFDLRGPSSPACGPVAAALGTTGLQLGRGPLTPTAWSWTSTRYLDVAATVSAPRQVTRGSVMTFSVTLINRDMLPYSLAACPNYMESLDGMGLVMYQLNCAAAGSIAPGGSRTFEMRFSVPGSAPLGPQTINWILQDTRVPLAGAVAELTVVS